MVNRNSSTIGRRGALRTIFASALGLGTLICGAAGALWTAAIVRFMRPNVANQPSLKFRAGPARDYSAERVETKFRDSHGVWIVCSRSSGAPRVFALRATCTHLGCVTLWQESQQMFQCPCHGSRFTKEGLNVAGPAPRPLERCAIRVDDQGQLEVDPGRTFQDRRGRWDDPESYVEV